MTYDTRPLVAAVDAIDQETGDAIAEIRRLEAVLATDPDRARIAILEQQLKTQVDLNAEQARQLVDDRLRIADLEQQLADCQAESDAPAILIGGSHPNGWQALRTMVNPAVPDGYRMFTPAPRLTIAHRSIATAVVNAGAVPFISVTKPTAKAVDPTIVSEDTVHNVETLEAAGLATAYGFMAMVHEPTQKMSGPDFLKMVAANYPYLRQHLPGWHLSLVFQRYDFEGAALARWPGNYTPADLSLFDSIGVDVYDKGPADSNGDGRTFADLMTMPEAFARSIRKPISIWEASAPDTGQYGRRPGWKPFWLDDAVAHMDGATLDDGSPLYVAWLAYNGTQGTDAPSAVGDIKAGWSWDTSPEARQAYIRAVASQQ